MIWRCDNFKFSNSLQQWRIEFAISITNLTSVKSLVVCLEQCIHSGKMNLIILIQRKLHAALISLPFVLMRRAGPENLSSPQWRKRDRPPKASRAHCVGNKSIPPISSAEVCKIPEPQMLNEVVWQQSSALAAAVCAAATGKAQVGYAAGYRSASAVAGIGCASAPPEHFDKLAKEGFCVVLIQKANIAGVIHCLAGLRNHPISASARFGLSRPTFRPARCSQADFRERLSGGRHRFC